MSTALPTDERMAEAVDFHTVLVANRGEIARRVIRTLRRLGIRSVAVYSDADAEAPHAREADVAVRIGPAAASESYLDIDAVIAAARATGAQAVHPGYGFLSENAAFARACAEAGIVFIGPGERALEVMGDKIRARDHVASHGVPIVPGFSAAGLSDDEIAERADAAGYPLLVKPSAGGGGKGMQVVRSADELAPALATARRVSASAFGDDTLLLERLIERPRHIEVQVMADAQGNVIHLGERECTLQRRHQKVIEEAPSPVIDAATRARLGSAACAAAASVDYVGAGTVEFLVAGDRPDDFFFIEMNTRLQVEHPVTELVTGLDLVELQLRVAAAEPLPLGQDDVVLTGHAIEARVYAESPARGFLPQTGHVLVWQPSTQARTDAAVETRSVVSAHYDPMIAKVITHADDRAGAVAALDRALADTVLLGVETNIGFLRTLLNHPDVVAGELDTGLIDRLPPYVDPEPPAEALTALATYAAAREWSAADSRQPRASTLWLSRSGWRMDAPAAVARQAFEGSDGAIVESVPDMELLREARSAFDGGWAPAHRSFDGVTVAGARDGLVWVHADGVTTALRPLTRRQAADLRLAQRERGEASADPDLRAPMPGAVVAVHVAEGDAVSTGDRIATIEAMKMEHPVTAPHDGIVTLTVAVGAQVRLGQSIARVEPRTPDTADSAAPAGE